jgi:hypothetical protein
VAGERTGNFCPCEYQPPVLGLRNTVQSGSTPTLHAYLTSMHWQLLAVSFASDNTIAKICVVITLGALQNTL